jgi:hypothetical protein
VAEIKNSFNIILRGSQYFTQLSDYNITEKDEYSESKIVTGISNNSTLMMIEFEWKLKFFKISSIIYR